MTGPIAFVVVFGSLVFIHELGHFLAARLAGVKVEEFGFGFPPRLATLGTWRGTTISLNWLPIGGFVRLADESSPGPTAWPPRAAGPGSWCTRRAR